MGNDTIDMYEINWFFYMKVHEKLRTSIDIIQNGEHKVFDLEQMCNLISIVYCGDNTHSVVLSRRREFLQRRYHPIGLIFNKLLRLPFAN